MSAEYLSLKSLKKAVLHCAKYSGFDVIGALSATDSYPMFHTRITTAITEVTLGLLKDENILGFYESRLRPPDTNLEPSKLIISLSQSLRLHGVSQVFILCIDSDWTNPSPLHLYALTSTSYTKIYEFPALTIRELQEFVNKNEVIHDFDEHFANGVSDWKNLHIN